MLEACQSPLEAEGQNYIWFAITKDGKSIYEYNDNWEKKDFTTDVYEPRYFMNTLGLMGKGSLYTMDLDIIDKEDIEANMFAHHVMHGEKTSLELPKIFLAHSTYPVEVYSLSTPNMVISNPKDDIFVRKYVHCDLKIVKDSETSAHSMIDYYALGYSNKIEMNGATIRYALMICVPNDDDRDPFYKIQLTSTKDINVDLYATPNIFCITDPHKNIELKAHERTEFDYRLG